MSTRWTTFSTIPFSLGSPLGHAEGNQCPPLPRDHVLMGEGVGVSQLTLCAGTCQLGSRDVSPGVLGNQVALLPADVPSQGKRI